jgi:hypothetical protein
MQDKDFDKPTKSSLTINFDTEDGADEFLEWMCGAGEQDLWYWQSCAEDEPENPKTYFDYFSGGWGDKTNINIKATTK